MKYADENSILQTHPDYFCTVLGLRTGSEYRFINDVNTPWEVQPQTRAILEAFREPTTVRGAFKVVSKRLREDIDDMRRGGFLLDVGSVSNRRNPSELTRALFKMAGRRQVHITHKNIARFITRTERIDGLALFVLDGLYQKREIEEIDAALSSQPHTLNTASDVTNVSYRCWGSSLPIDLPFFNRQKACMNVLFPEFQIHPYLALCNMIRYGDHLYKHKDSRLPSVTTLYYANKEWGNAWDGETVFYNKKAEPIVVVAPRPGRVVVARGEIIHRAGVPSRVYEGPRITVAMQTQVS